MITTETAGPLRVPTLRFIGNNIGYPGDVLYVDVVTQGNSERLTKAFWCYAAENHDAPQWDLGFVDPGSPTYRHVAEILRINGPKPTSAESSSYVGVDLPSNWDEFLAGISRNTRQNFRRRLRKLEREGEVRVRLDSDHSDVHRRILELIRNHERWSAGTPREAWFGGRRTKTFLAEAGELLARAGSYAVFSLEVDGNPVAWSAGAVDVDCYFEQLISYDHGYARFSPGMTLSVLMVKNLLAMGLKRLELGPGYDQRKGSLGGQPEPHHRLLGYRGWLRLMSRIRTWFRSGRDE